MTKLILRYRKGHIEKDATPATALTSSTSVQKRGATSIRLHGPLLGAYELPPSSPVTTSFLAFAIEDGVPLKSPVCVLSPRMCVSGGAVFAWRRMRIGVRGEVQGRESI